MDKKYTQNVVVVVVVGGCKRPPISKRSTISTGSCQRINWDGKPCLLSPALSPCLVQEGLSTGPTHLIRILYYKE